VSNESTSPLTLYLRKLLQFGPLSAGAESALLALPARLSSYPVYRDIVREGEPTTSCCLVLEGIVSRYKTLRNGGRQILSFHIAGDMVDLQSSLMEVSDHSIRSHTPIKIAHVEHEAVLQAAEQFADLGRAFWFDTLCDAAIFREWTVNVGRRTGRERLAHLLLEFGTRLRLAGLSDGRTFTLPITQADLADATGLSPVHLNRSLQSLRREGWIRTSRRDVEIFDRESLALEAGFSADYLQPKGPRRLR
jgi:CRP-like cAMP-binding protein